MADEKRVTQPRGITQKMVLATLYTAEDQLKFCELHNLPVGAQRARDRIKKCNERLAEMRATKEEAA